MFYGFMVLRSKPCEMRNQHNVGGRVSYGKYIGNSNTFHYLPYAGSKQVSYKAFGLHMHVSVALICMEAEKCTF